MRFRSTRSGGSAGLVAALVAGLAPDGGLYVPETLPAFSPEDFDGAETPAQVGEILLAPFFAGSALAGALPDVLGETFGFDVPLRSVDAAPTPLSVLELFHGPTAAFKDVGARFLAACLQRIEAEQCADERPVTILVATSGDTGGAVAAAFHRRPGFRVVVLFPLGMVSPRQQQQLTCWGDNVVSVAVRGTFDDCQRLVKGAFADAELGERHRFSSANSINIGRLLPQTVYYAHAALAHWRERGEASSVIVPTGNLGNGLAAVMARAMGLPLGDVVFATNANRTIADYLEEGEYRPRASVRTLASAMDVGDPSNMERLRNLFGEADRLRGSVEARVVEDDVIREQIRRDYEHYGLIECPHTATAMHVWETLPAERRTGRHWIAVATAHAAKFPEVVEPLIGTTVPVPEALADLLALPAHYEEIEPALPALGRTLEGDG
ncbi:threonine synthase [Lentisalinibacter salinarum]|uniref:threonine synthase n=1 Tax=Lentisalinibacter salinarum TaxID=2992239 RepID=UPI0038701FDE